MDIFLFSEIVDAVEKICFDVGEVYEFSMGVPSGISMSIAFEMENSDIHQNFNMIF